jgi:hypothetical protein
MEPMKQSKSDLFWRLTISGIGFLMIITAVTQLSLGFFGEKTIGTISAFRRIGGERAEAIPNRYTYSLEYRYIVGGVEYTGTTTQIGSPLFTKVTGEEKLNVNYFVSFPQISCPEQDSNIDMGKAALIGMGGLLIKVMNTKKTMKKLNKKSKS